MAYTIEELDGAIEILQEKKKELESGEEFCEHHWNGSDRCYECYCSGCGRHIREVYGNFDIPLKKHAYCYECQKTPEEKAEEKERADQALKNSELEKLAALRAKYPDA